MTKSLRERIAQLHELAEWMRLVKAQTGKSGLQQLRDIMKLKTLGGKCGVSDYYWHKIYDEAYLAGDGPRDFLGWKLQQELSLALNPRCGVLPAWDKLVFAQLASAAELPVAPILATFHRAQQLPDSLGVHLSSLEAAAVFLRDTAIYPLFAKPAFSQQSYGSAYLVSYDEASDRLQLLDGSTLAIDEFLVRLEKTVDYRFHKPESGFLFQKPLKPAPEIMEITNWSALCGLRVVCLNDPVGSFPIRAAWKIALPPNHMDNFGMGDHGNLLANVDLETGEVSRVIGGFWPKTREFTQHPITGKSLENFRLPGWERVLDIIKRAGPVFPLMKIHHWDFALTDLGPVILELNDIGGTQIAQMHGRGVLTQKTRDFLKQYGDRAAYPWIATL